MKLGNERICCVPFSESEITDRYMSWLNNKEVCKYNSHGEELYTKEKALVFLESLKDNEFRKVYAVYALPNRVHIGNISLQQIDLKNRSAEVALLFGEKKFWGQGYATDALKCLLSLGKELKLHRLYFGTHIDNIAMQKVGIKCGFQQEGILKDAQLKDGRYNDIVMFGLLLGDN